MSHGDIILEKLENEHATTAQALHGIEHQIADLYEEISALERVLHRLKEDREALTSALDESAAAVANRRALNDAYADLFPWAVAS